MSGYDYAAWESNYESTTLAEIMDELDINVSVFTDSVF